MAVLNSEKQIKNKSSNLIKDYPWFYSNMFNKIQKSTVDFFRKDFKLRFIGIAFEDNILFYGDEYFVNKISVNKNSSIITRISSSLVSSILDNTLGMSETAFSLKNLTDLEANLIKSYSAYLYSSIESLISKNEVNKKIIKASKNYNFTFYVQYGNEHAGKIILTVPEYMIDITRTEKIEEKFSINDFKNTYVNLTVGTGATRVPLNDVKALEAGDIIVLEDSDINKMAVIWNGKKVPFNITPNPSLIISIDSNGGNEMEEEQNLNPKNMWDSILVDVVAEFDNVKLSLGELKQISEGLVIDVGSVYENKIKLRVENQVVATGELVILNDRYGVKIDNVKKAKEETEKVANTKKEPEKASVPKKPAAKPEAAPPKKPPVKQPQDKNAGAARTAPKTVD